MGRHRNDRNYRNYASEAFRFWARCGCISYDDAKKAIKNNGDLLEAVYLLEKRRSRNVSHIPTQNRIALNPAMVKAVLEDIRACDAVFVKLTDRGDEVIKSAVRAIYMERPFEELHKGDVSARVIKFSLAVPVSESQVYNYLAEARRMFAEYRGLRLDFEL